LEKQNENSKTQSFLVKPSYKKALIAKKAALKKLKKQIT